MNYSEADRRFVMKRKVRSVMKKKVTCIVVALLCGVAGCGGPSVEQARR